MARLKTEWNKLSMKERALYLKLGLLHGLSGLKDIKDTYNLYASGGKLAHKYDGNTEETSLVETTVTPTKELYITQKLDSVRNNALEKSRNKTQDKTTIIYEADVFGKKELISMLQRDYNTAASWFNYILEASYKNYKRNNPILSEKYTRLDVIENYPDFQKYLKYLNDAKKLIEDAKNGEYKGHEVYNCIANLSEMFPHGLPYGNKTFAGNPEKYGFSLIDTQDVKPGDFIQFYHEPNEPLHAMIYNGVDKNGKHTFNYSKGQSPYMEDGVLKGGYGTNKHYPDAVSKDGKHLTNVNVYRYTGTPQDSIQWSNEWELQYGTLKALGGPLSHKKSVNRLGENSHLYETGGLKEDSISTKPTYDPFAPVLKVDTVENYNNYVTALNKFLDLGFKGKLASDLALLEAHNNMMFYGDMLPEVVVVGKDPTSQTNNEAVPSEISSTPQVDSLHVKQRMPNIPIIVPTNERYYTKDEIVKLFPAKTQFTYEEVMKAFIDAGYNEHAAAALTGVAMKESGLNMFALNKAEKNQGIRNYGRGFFLYSNKRALNYLDFMNGEYTLPKLVTYVKLDIDTNYPLVREILKNPNVSVEEATGAVHRGYTNGSSDKILTPEEMEATYSPVWETLPNYPKYVYNELFGKRYKYAQNALNAYRSFVNNNDANLKSTGGFLNKVDFSDNYFLTYPGKKYDDGGDLIDVNLPQITVMPRENFITYTGDETFVPTKSQYVKSKQDEYRVVAAHKMLNTVLPVTPIIPNLDFVSRLMGKLGMSDAKRMEKYGICEDPLTCINTVTSMYPKENVVPGTATFRENSADYGFIPTKQYKLGDVALFPHHGTMVTGNDINGKPVLSYSRGHSTMEDMVIDNDNWYYPLLDGYLSNLGTPVYYRFVGTPTQQNKWELEWLNKYHIYDKKTHKKSTGGPLYPFSFEKNPFLKTPAVRYDEGGQTYTVKSGDYLGNIAKQYGLTVDDIVSVNPGLNPDKINVGQVLNIPNINKTPSKEAIISAAWLNENPNNVGYKNGLYYPYKDPNGRGMNVGPGLLVGVAIPEKESYTKEELDAAAYTYGLNSLNAIGQAFNEKYGTTELATPFDTVSIAPKLLALDTRYLNGSLPVSGWPSFYKALAEGNWSEALKQSRSTYIDSKGVKHYDNDRVMRRAEALFPNMFNVTFKPDSKEFPKVTKK